MILRYASIVTFVAAALGGCDRPRDSSDPPAAMPQPAGARRPTVLFVGTSLTAGLGVDPDDAYPALLQRKIDSAGMNYQVVNAGVSGETSAGARRRIDWLFDQPISTLVIETGANDGLRGQDPDSVKANIQAIVDAAGKLDPKPRVLLLGMRALPNYGFTYARRFGEVYTELARENDIPLVPFLLEGVAGIDSLNQPDGVHPTPAGHRRIAETVWPALRDLLAEGSGA